MNYIYDSVLLKQTNDRRVWPFLSGSEWPFPPGANTVKRDYDGEGDGLSMVILVL